MRSYRIPTTKQIRSLEADWIKRCGESWSQVLMEVAGRAAAYQALKLWQQELGLVTILCGRGNNGGDGLVVARYLNLWGVPLNVVILSKDADAKMSTNESETNRRILENMDQEVVMSSEVSMQDLLDSSIIVDALFGTGLDRDLEGIYRTTVDAVNRSAKTVLSIDMPSGVNSDSGAIMGVAVRADHTVTFGYLKPGLVCHPGADLAGDITVIDIGLPDLDDDKPHISLATSDHVRGVLPPRANDSNKGSFGTVLTVAGSLGMSGATLLSSESALRSGAGLVFLATPKSLVLHLPPGEVIYIPIAETGQHSIAQEAIKDLEKHVDKATAIILGPGMSTHSDTKKFVGEFLSETLPESGKACVIDADALNAIAENPAVFPKSAEKIVITPHPKELSRLMNLSVQSIQADRLKAAKEAAEKFQCVVVLKGSRTIVANPKGEFFINPTGNAGMATAGAGDVLSGIIGGLLAQGLSSFDAATAGVYLHGAAGDYAAAELGEAGIIAGDIMHAIPFAIANLEKGAVSAFEEQMAQQEPQV